MARRIFFPASDGDASVKARSGTTARGVSLPIGSGFGALSSIFPNGKAVLYKSSSRLALPPSPGHRVALCAIHSRVHIRGGKQARGSVRAWAEERGIFAPRE